MSGTSEWVTQAHCTEVHLAATLESLGHKLTRVQEDSLAGDLLARVETKTDLVLWTRTWPDFVTLRDLQTLRDVGIPTASYHLDLYVGIQRQDGLDRDPFWRTEHVFTPDGDPRSAEVFRAKGINHHYMPPGVYKPECIKGVPRAEFTSDVCFVGGGAGYHEADWPYRVQLVDWLRRNYGGRFGKWGNPERTIRNRDLNDLYASVKVVVGDSLCKNGHERYWSDRVYETTGRGAFIIHPRIRGLEEEFEEGKEIIFYDYGNFDQLRELIDHYVADDHAREAIRDAGQERTRTTHTYTERLNEMLEIVKSA